MTNAVIADACCRLALPVACLLVAACTTRPGLNTTERTLAASAPDLTSATLSASSGREKAIAAYRDYLARYPDRSEHDNITRRLADLLVEQAADMQLAVTTAPEDAARLEAKALQTYREAIGYYEYLLKKNLRGPDRTDLLYQLSRAYAESGQTQQALTAIDRLLVLEPDTNMRLYADTRFRRGELLFAQGAYREAGQSYQAVVDLGASVPAYEQALYKLGWSLFKQEHYVDALPLLVLFLDRKIAAGEAFDAQLPRLSPADREQVADVFRVISMSFAQLGGVDSVDRFFSRNGSRNYEDHIYLDLAEWYVAQQQISEAAGSWLALARRNPLGAQAPRLIAQAISLYREAGFQQPMLETETLLVHDYGMGSDFWTVHLPADFPDVMQLLQSSLQELAQVSRQQARKTGDAHAMRKAEQWYREYLASFGDEAGAAEMNYQLAELLYENGNYRQALDEYEQTAWSRGAHPRAAEAALGALHASEKVLQHADAADKAGLTERATAGALRFVMNYPDHSSAPALLARSGTVLLEQQQHTTALHISERVLEEAVSAGPALRQVAWSLRAQVLFAMEDYAAAAAAYGEALQLAGEDDPRRLALQQGLATATYKQAGQTLKRGDKTAAVALYQQAAQLAPVASIRSIAQYDAATALLAQESWAEAIRILVQFRRDYPDDPLQQEVTRKLAYAYDRGGNNSQAASEYLRLGQERQQANKLQREALLRAADIYMQTGAVRQAISTRELYLERFPQPATIAVNQMQQLADVEHSNGNSDRRQYWLEAIIRLDRTAGTPQTRGHAAEAALALAENRLVAFRRIQLVNPVQNNLALKLKAMKRALQAFEAAIDYGISTVTSAATYQIASMYDELGRALLTSERPDNLTAEELAEYDLLLTEQATAFAQQAIDIYTTNVQRSGGDVSDPWVEKSAQRLDELQIGRELPAGASVDAN